VAHIAVVTDSTCDLAPEGLAAIGVTAVPLKVHFGDETYRDWVDLSPEQFFKKLVAAQTLPTTSQPTPGEFAAEFQRLADQGADGIVSIHLSSKLSGTYESAATAASQATIPVRVVDTSTVSGAMQLSIAAACETRDRGAGLDDVERAARQRAGSTELFFFLNTLDYLVKGGRAGKATGLAAVLLNIKPVLEVRGGIVEPFRNSKGTRKAIFEISAHVAERSKALGQIDIVIINALAAEHADALESAIIDAGTNIARVTHSEAGALIGTYSGPGAAGVASSPVR
jgi:DegV family protein with EDD domain